MKVYFISGLAADKRVFHQVQLPEGYEAVYLEWITALEGETLQQYACRMAADIDAREPFVLVGLSMGGMIATEIAKQLNPVATILISSIPLSSHLPGYFRLAAKFRLHKIIPIGMIKSAAVAKRFITRENAADKKLLRQVIKESDPVFIRWCLGAVLNWHNEELPPRLYHIHGSRDEVLPARFTRPTLLIKKAGHMLVLTNAREINRFLKEVLPPQELTA